MFDRGAAARYPTADDDFEGAVFALLYIEGATDALDSERFDPGAHVLRTFHGGRTDDYAGDAGVK